MFVDRIGNEHIRASRLSLPSMTNGYNESFFDRRDCLSKKLDNWGQSV